MTFLGLLGLLLIALKLTHVIAWSWWLILLPLYGICLGLLIVLIILIMLIGAGNVLLSTKEFFREI